MPFAIPLIFLADLFAAALTFGIVASVPMWRRSAITAPVFVFIASPMTSLAVVLAMAVSPMERYVRPGSDYRLPVILSVLAVASIVAAYLAGLACRFVFQTVAPLLENWLGLRRFLILQAAIFCGGTLSLLVWLILSPNVAHLFWVQGLHWVGLAVGLVGALGVLACMLALLRLGTPEQYLPRPLPKFLSQRIYGDRCD